MGGWVDVFMCMEGYVHGRICAWKDMCMEGYVHGRICAWMDA
jgi:hypothetical protein